MKLRIVFVNIMCQGNPEYKRHVIYENVKGSIPPSAQGNLLLHQVYIVVVQPVLNHA